jgi:recombination protein RecA
MYGEGVSRLGSIIDMASDLDIVDKSGAWYSYNGARLGQGKEKVKEMLKGNPELCAELEAQVRAKLLAPEEEDEPEAPAPAEKQAASEKK